MANASATHTEIERKFLVDTKRWSDRSGGVPYRQAYLSKEGNTVRARIAGDKAYLTIKGKAVGISRPEFEYEIPVADAEALFGLAVSAVVDKTRYRQTYGGKLWEIDVFHGDNEGLVVAEIELNSEDEAFEKPEWLGPEVSADKRYTNAALARNPYKNWKAC
ncbi:MAG: CYTH domain-containing protein [Paludibacteraceae bacterium]|nr:CYTH domain-containing protein [Paludibacteraceae bacterium]